MNPLSLIGKIFLGIAILISLIGVVIAVMSVILPLELGNDINYTRLGIGIVIIVIGIIFAIIGFILQAFGEDKEEVMDNYDNNILYNNDDDYLDIEDNNNNNILYNNNNDDYVDIEDNNNIYVMGG